MATFENVKIEDLKDLEQHGFYKVPLKTPYEVARFKGLATLVLFKTGKLLIQGKQEKEVIKILKNLEVGKLVKDIKFLEQVGTYIGSDEALKGDTFGGMVVAAVKANQKERESLIWLGVGDSKKITDNKVEEMAKNIKKVVKYHIEELTPSKYNDMIIATGKVTEVLNILHGKCIKELKPGKAVVDKYPGCRVGDIITTKAESKYVEVAAASILARDCAVKQLRKIGDKLNIVTPKGSTHIKDALKTAVNSNIPLKNLVKLHFNNVKSLTKDI